MKGLLVMKNLPTNPIPDFVAGKVAFSQVLKLRERLNNVMIFLIILIPACEDSRHVAGN